jgi:hypothetical protein
LRDLRLRGDRFQFSFVDDHGALCEFSGRVLRSAIAGSVRIAGKPAGAFRAERTRAG